MHSRLKRLVAGGSLLVALGVTAFLIAHFVGAQEGEQEGDLLTRGRLLVSSRTHLSLCVDGAAGYQASDADVQAVRQGLEDALASLSAVPVEYGQPQVSAGCPTPLAALTDETLPPTRLLLHLETSEIVDSPSPHRTLVYLLPEDRYRALFGALPSLVSNRECILRGDVCYGATDGLYLPASASEDVLREALLSSLGFGTPRPQPTLDCDLGTPHPLCER